MTSHLPETPPDVPGYEIIRPIGVGGMGEVYLAHQQTLNRPVAIKFLARTTPELTEERERRFRREAELMASVSHPNVLTIFDFGSANDRPYLVMEFVPTGDLRSRMEPGSPMKLEEVREILGPVVRAVEHLHRLGIVHRDLKPENILIHEGTPKVSDFGIAVLEDEFGSLTRTGVSLGTPGYVAPEQQYRLKVDERVDQFSLASLTYEMVTGRKPLGIYPPPSKLNPRLGRAAEAAILRGLSDDPTDRFASMGELGENFDRGLKSSRHRFVDRRHSGILASGLLGIAAVGLLFANLGGDSIRDRPDSQRNGPVVGSNEAASRPRSIVARAANLKLVLVPSGEFWMGSPTSDPAAQANERPSHLVKLTKSFYVGETEVTVKQFRAFVEAENYRTTAELHGGGWKYSPQTKARQQNSSWTWWNPGEPTPQADNEPVVQVSWVDANAFCEWLSRREGRVFRLLTEAEWEYACRAGSSTRWSSGDEPEPLQESAWTLRNARGRFHPVGTLKPNRFGLYDMHGNAWEWCSDWIGPYSSDVRIDPQEPESGKARILRGGSFDWYNVDRLRSASRIGYAPEMSYYYYGFRIGSTATETAETDR